MSRIHPTHHRRNKGKDFMSKEANKVVEDPSVLTVWKRSSMSFQGTDGFTVFDHHGKLAFRVDNYSTGGGGPLILMDGAGNALLTLKPQIFSLQCQWNAYKGDGCCRSRNSSGMKPEAIFCMRSSGSMLFNGGKDEAQVFMGSGCKGHDQTPDFRVEGCFRRRNCIIRNNKGAIAARIARKRVNKTVLLGDDVFSLVVQPGFKTELMMAFVLVLDRIYIKPFTPFLCS